MINLKKIIEYIRQHNIAEEIFERETDIAVSRLSEESTILDAEEYLKICIFLDVDPRLFYEKKQLV